VSACNVAFSTAITLPTVSYEFAVYRWPFDYPHGELYEHPLGGHQSVTRYWLEPATQLGLHLLSQLSSGWLVIEPDQLPAFGQELNKLPGYWVTAVPEDDMIHGIFLGRGFATPQLVELLHRIALLRAAIRMAEVTRGCLLLTG
jgi:hypothetical protein